MEVRGNLAGVGAQCIELRKLQLAAGVFAISHVPVTLGDVMIIKTSVSESDRDDNS